MSISLRYRFAALLALVLSYPAVIGVYIAVMHPWTARVAGAATSPQVLMAYVSMMVVAVLLAPRLGPRCAASFLCGALSTAAVFLVGVLSGCLAAVFFYSDFSMRSYVYKPAFWISVYGFAPACMLGLVTTLLARLARRFSNEPGNA